MDGSETRSIELPQGGTLEITMGDKFNLVLRKHFNLSSDAKIEDDHIRMFLFGAVKNALDKAETSDT
jgi:hypothetical protein